MYSRKLARQGIAARRETPIVDLFEAWTTVVRARDMDAHMARNGQADANAKLLAWMLGAIPPSPGGRILMPGAGTGQFLDRIETAALEPWDWIFTDVNTEFLDFMHSRLRRHRGVSAAICIDDAEAPNTEGPLCAVLTALLLEHVDWKKALAAWAALSPGWIGIVIERDDATGERRPTPRPLRSTIARFEEVARPHLVPERELADELARLGYLPHARREEPVPDARAMVALLHRREAA
jgi:hypothetical protein